MTANDILESAATLNGQIRVQNIRQIVLNIGFALFPQATENCSAARNGRLSLNSVDGNRRVAVDHDGLPVCFPILSHGRSSAQSGDNRYRHRSHLAHLNRRRRFVDDHLLTACRVEHDLKNLIHTVYLLTKKLCDEF